METLSFLYPSRDQLAALVDGAAHCLSSPITHEACGKFWASVALACLISAIVLFFLVALRWWLDHPTRSRSPRSTFKPPPQHRLDLDI